MKSLTRTIRKPVQSCLHECRSLSKVFFCTLVAPFLFSCVTTVDESSRNKDGRFDGKWVGQVASPPPDYRVENWIVKCGYEPFSFNLSVNDGKATVGLGRVTGQGFINDDGKFRVVIPIERKLENKASNKGSLMRGINLVIDGSMGAADGVGRYTQGYEDLGNQGCNSKVTYKKSS